MNSAIQDSLCQLGLGLTSKGRIRVAYPFEAFENGAGVVPYFGIGSRNLTAVGERGLHRSVAVALKQRDSKAACLRGRKQL